FLGLAGNAGCALLAVLTGHTELSHKVYSAHPNTGAGGVSRQNLLPIVTAGARPQCTRSAPFHEAALALILPVSRNKKDAPVAKTLIAHLEQEIENIRAAGLYKPERVITSPQSADI